MLHNIDGLKTYSVFFSYFSFFFNICTIRLCLTFFLFFIYLYVVFIFFLNSFLVGVCCTISMGSKLTPYSCKNLAAFLQVVQLGYWYNFIIFQNLLCLVNTNITNL